MKNKIFAFSITAMLTGCAATYEKPNTPAPDTAFPTSASKSSLLTAIKQTLASEGYQITFVDENSGVISTAPRDMKLSPADADCGTTMGIDYLKDNRTHTTVAVNAIAKNGELRLKTTVQGDYRPGSVDQNLTLTCVSRGTIEAALANTITNLSKK